MSGLFKIEHGVPQINCLSPIIILAYISYLYYIINTYTVSVGGYADDQQLYIHFRRAKLLITNSLLSLETCIKSVCNFFLVHYLLIKYFKTEFIIFGSEHLLYKVKNIELRVGNSIILPSNNFKDLGVIFDNYLNFEDQILQVNRKSSYRPFWINQINKYLDYKTSNLDYCYILYFNLLRIQNFAVLIIVKTPYLNILGQL